MGEKIGLDYLINAFNRTAIVNCNEKCELEELWLCVERISATGLPGGLIECPSGARNVSDSCRKYRCEYVFIPPRNQSVSIDSLNDNPENYLLTILFYAIVLKFIFVCFASIHSFCAHTNKTKPWY